MLIRPTVNGTPRSVEVEPEWSLLRALRDGLGLEGAKNACRQGECGSCTVWLDGEIVCACLVPAVQADGLEVRTVESLAGGTLHPVQQGLVDAGAVQCGYCMPGIVVAAADLLDRNPVPSETAIRTALAGNLCRCTGYQKIVEGVLLAAKAGVS